ncbi:MAG: GlsB/YeaQ/YmgE family stress response membrane protein [Nitrospiraceae bacterium]
MTVIGWIVFGLIVGVVAKFLMPGPDPGGMVVTILIGIAGALVGGYIGRGLGWYHEGDPVGFLMALAGAILLLFAYRQLLGTSRST